MKNYWFLVLLVSLTFIYPSQAQSSMKEVEKQRLAEEKARQKQLKKSGVKQNKKKSSAETDLALTDKRPQKRKRGKNVGKSTDSVATQKGKFNQKNSFRKNNSTPKKKKKSKREKR